MKRTPHDLSHAHSTTFNMGQLIPIAAVDVLPGDTLRCASSALLRISPQVNPVYHDCEIRVHNWFVPNRILWDGWEDFIVGDTDSSGAYPTHTIQTGDDLVDYMGIEPINGKTIDALPIRAYNMIFNEYYRDQDLDQPVSQDDAKVLRVRWAKDYLTTARPQPQQGTAIDIPFAPGSNAPVIADATDQQDLAIGLNATPTQRHRLFTSGNGIRAGAVDEPTAVKMFADLANASGSINVNDLRQGIALQKIAEARAFFGSRYQDYLRWYGINPRDGRLSRPEYLGGGRGRINFSEVLSTAETTNSKVGDLYGHGIAGVRTRPYRKMFEEHGWMFSLAFVRPRGVYQNGIPRRFRRTDPTDYWHRELELLPWQDVKTTEVFGAADDGKVFGYSPRYDEYREIQNHVTGTMRGGTEEDWHLARKFESEPTLNSSFVECTPSNRIYADGNKPQVIARFNMQINGRRLVRGNARIMASAGL